MKPLFYKCLFYAGSSHEITCYYPVDDNFEYSKDVLMSPVVTLAELSMLSGYSEKHILKVYSYKMIISKSHNRYTDFDLPF